MVWNQQRQLCSWGRSVFNVYGCMTLMLFGIVLGWNRGPQSRIQSLESREQLANVTCQGIFSLLRQFQCDITPTRNTPLQISINTYTTSPPISALYSLFAGNLILYTKMAVEILGGWQDSCAHHGLRHRHLFRSREKQKKKLLLDYLWENLR